LPQNAKVEVEGAIHVCAIQCNLVSPNFVQYLRELNNAFVDWRYIFEKSDTGSIYVLHTIFVMQVLETAFHLVTSE
jgi:hypothetical protein